ncbi:uncharacterized protein AC631_01880 [Debaryomyces fabryi]|uniref:K Homology domain-containing protein n=1 Tax=Debaryomyces fabryi TaxID=58627 RepID=A0A0V1Q1J4_9ASCO|nr:uncharacterized protein AC631_01880 [Debaryomyces fabryi]KSA02322.1 hypothetical protein AC631_01880 [Debaryomyces fabryi]CUM51482.1 unnamed protein product [Debaryomyces fabryi]
MLLQPTPIGSSDSAYGPESTSDLIFIENESRSFNRLSSPRIGESQEYYGEDYLDADDEWIFSSLYLYNTFWIKYAEIKNSYTYGKSSGESSLISIDRLHDATGHDDLLKEIRVRICSKQILQFMLELNKNYEAEIFLEHSNTYANTNSAWIMCKKLCVDEWMISFAPIKNKNMRHIISTLARLHFESAQCIDLFVTKTKVPQIETYICKISPNLSCLDQFTFSGDVIRIRPIYPPNPNHPTESDITESVRQLLDVMDSHYSDITIHGPLYDYPLCPRSIANITTTLRKKIKVSEIPQPTDIIRKVLLLKKHEVSFLMGFQGTRINSIRRSSSCVIKVLPFSTTMDATFIPIKNSPQDLMICGTPANVQYSINLIQNYLIDYRNNNS